MNQKKELFAFAFSVAFLPPFWAVVSPYVGVSTGAVALICAGVFAAGGSNPKDALKTSLSFLTGDVWAVLSLWLQQKLPLPANLGLYTIFFALGGVAVLVCGALPRIFHTPSWLAGWAIGVTIIPSFDAMGTLPVQIGVAMLVGVYYVGLGCAALQNRLLGRKKADTPGGISEK